MHKKNSLFFIFLNGMNQTNCLTRALMSKDALCVIGRSKRRLTKQHYVTPRDENTLVMLVSLASL